MLMLAVLCTATARAAAAWTDAADAVTMLPTYGKPRTPTYSAFADATPDGKNRIHYWSGLSLFVFFPTLCGKPNGPAPSTDTQVYRV